jgi:hypothetical protein
VIIISLGWGTQSSALAFMSALGILPRADACIFADTLYEREQTYEYAKQWTPWLEERGIPCYTVTNQQAAVDAGNKVTIPAYSPGARRVGMLKRQCTTDWKIRPLRRQIQALRKRQKVQLWMGITADEAQRQKQSDVRYLENVYPFLDPQMMPDGKTWTREDVKRWLGENSFGVPPRSSCYFCPFQGSKEWQALKHDHPGDFEKAVAFDAAIRDKRPPSPIYVHRKCVPLDAVDLRTEAELGQHEMSLDGFAWGECTGRCGN